MPHVVVVGAGVFGAWTAHHLRAAGAQVTLIDQYGPANPRASSGDHSRILRCGYGADEIYSRFARRSLVQWRALEERSSGVALASVRGTSAGGGRRPLLHRHQTDARGGRLRARGAGRLAPSRALSAPRGQRRRDGTAGARVRRADGAPCRAHAGPGTGAVGDRVSPRAGRRCAVTGYGEVAAPRRRRRRARRRLRVCLRSLAAVGLPLDARRSHSADASERDLLWRAARRRTLRPGVHTSVDRSSCWHIRHPRRGGLRRESRDRRAWPAHRSGRRRSDARRRRNRPRTCVGRAAVPGDERCARRGDTRLSVPKTPPTAIS